MKKSLIKFISLISILAFSLSFLPSCGLVTVNTERDMAQVVAEIKISDDVNADYIYKRDLISAFNSYGYYYVNYNGYTISQAYEEILKSLVQNRIVVQKARETLTTKQDGYSENEKGYFGEATASLSDTPTELDKVLVYIDKEGLEKIDISKINPKSNIEDFLSEYEIAESKYNVYSSILSSVLSLVDVEEEDLEEYEKITIASPRATLGSPEDKDGNEAELKDISLTVDYINRYNKILTDIEAEEITDLGNKYDFNLEFYNRYNNNVNSYIVGDKDRKSALRKVARKLNKNGLITDDEISKVGTVDSIDKLLSYNIFKENYESELESRLVEKFEMALENQARKNIAKSGINVDEDAIYNEYVELYNKQKELYSNNYSTYETDLSSNTEDLFIVYNPSVASGKFGYVLNLLIGFSEDQTTALNNIKSKAKSQQEIDDYRDSLGTQLIVKDLRKDWVYSNYGYIENDSYYFNDIYCKTECLKKYDGTLEGTKEYTYKDSSGIEKIGNSFTDVTPREIPFAEFKDNILTTVLENPILGEISTNLVDGNLEISEELLLEFRDFVYAYSTDSGSLAENYGYLYSPITSKTTYVTEFAEAAKNLIDAGAGSYTICLTDYGYHIMLCTKVIDADNEIIEKANFESSDLGIKFIEYKTDLFIDSEIGKIASSFINGISEDETKVSYYKDAYSDLLED